MSKKKILYVVESMGGGVFTYVVELANALSKDFDMYIAYATRPQTPENYRDYFNKEIRLIEVQNFCRSLNPVKDLKAFFEIKKIVKDVKPDIVHLHSSKAGAIGRLAINGKKIPCFYTPHGYSFLMLDQSKLKRGIYKAIEKICGKRTCKTISCSKGEHDESVKLTKKADYINNGIDMEELQQVLDVIPQNSCSDNTVFTIGRICEQKNPKLFNEIAEAMPEVRFIWIGDGELRDELSAPNIQITGWLDRKDVISHAQQCNNFILTSLWEGLPISLLEAMYMKKTCIVSNVIGNRDVIRTGYNGYVCDNVSDFVEAINQSKGCGTILGDNAYKDVVEKYNTRVMAEAYKKVYSI